MNDLYSQIEFLHSAWIGAHSLICEPMFPDIIDEDAPTLEDLDWYCSEINSRYGCDINEKEGTSIFTIEKQILLALEKILINSDEQGRTFILRRLIRRIPHFAHDYDFVFIGEDITEEYPITEAAIKRLGRNVEAARNIETVLFWIALGTIILCEDLGLDIQDIAPVKISDQMLERRDKSYYDKPNMTKSHKKYKTMPRNQQIPAICALLKLAGINRDVTPDTDIASFVEAVTGGNTEKDPQNTYAYKYLNDGLTTQTKEMFKKIGLIV